MLRVSKHAVKRYKERFLDLDRELSNKESLHIENIIRDYVHQHPIDGIYSTDDIKVVIENGIAITVYKKGVFTR